MAYSRFFVVAGFGESDTSGLNAFDHALVDAGIAQLNLVPVSSIIPEDASETQPIDLPAAKITHCVIARCDCRQGETISAGIAWAQLEHYGIVAEDAGHHTQLKLQENLTHKIQEMAESRRQQPHEIKYKTKTKKVTKKHGTTIAALIYVE
jgi:arginine decarboxylase